MSNSRYSISCILKNPLGECFTDKGWEKGCDEAILFTPQQAKATEKLLSLKQTTDITVFYLIQNDKFNYLDDNNEWAYNLSSAKLYTSAKEAEMKIRQLLS